MNAQEKTGFYGAADLNFGLGVASGGGDSRSEVGAGISIRPGYQINDEWIGMLDIFFSGFDGLKNNGFLLSGQYYLEDNMYIRPGVGLSRLIFDVEGIPVFNPLTGMLETSADSVKTDLGLALSVAGGYEFEINEMFTAGPTARIIYNNITDGGGTFWNIVVGAEIKGSF